MSKCEARDAAVRHLLEAIDRVRQDVARVEIWAVAVTEFTQPIRDYEPAETSIWLPSEQATNFKRRGS
jgi:hypothetical protein